MDNRKDINEKVDDYGTFFYKLRNGTLPFEHDTNKSIDKIYKLMDKKYSDLICGLLSVIISEYLNQNWKIYQNKPIYFIIGLIVGFLVLKLILFIFNFVNEKIKELGKDSRISEIEDEEIQDLFYRKIVVQTAYVFSVVKRIQELESDKRNSRKKELTSIYTMQGIYGVRKIYVELENILFKGKTKKRSNYVYVIGKENLLIVIKMLNDCLYNLAFFANGEEDVWSNDYKMLEELENEVKKLAQN